MVEFVSTFDFLASSEILTALFFLATTSLLEAVTGYHIMRRYERCHVVHWCWERLLGPLARALIACGFVLIAYPALFAIRSAPAISELAVGATLAAYSPLVFALFVSLLLPMFKTIAERAFFLSALQAIIATALLFSIYSLDLGATSARIWPGLSAALIIVLLMIVGHRLALELARALGPAIDRRWRTDNAARAVLHWTAPLVQTPAILLYGFVLGQQVAI